MNVLRRNPVRANEKPSFDWTHGQVPVTQPATVDPAPVDVGAAAAVVKESSTSSSSSSDSSSSDSGDSDSDSSSSSSSSSEAPTKEDRMPCAMQVNFTRFYQVFLGSIEFSRLYVALLR